MATNTQKYFTHASKIDSELATIPVGHPLRELLEVASKLLFEAAAVRVPTSDRDTTRVALIDRGYHWTLIDANSPHGSKMQLVNRQYGVAIYGSITSRDQFFTHWAPLPTFCD